MTSAERGTHAAPLRLWILCGYDASMSIPSLYGTTGQSPSESGMMVVASGQATNATETVAQLTELNTGLKRDISVFKGLAATGFALAGIAGVYIFWQKSLEKRAEQAKSEGGMPQQAAPFYGAPKGYGPPRPYAYASAPPPYGYAPEGYR